jgi:hypothetical protein
MKKIRWKTILRMVALIVVVAIAWGICRDRLSLANWAVPVEYDGDGLEFIAWIKAASEGDFIPFIREGSHRLAAPYQANWDDYPAAEKIYICFLGIAANLFGLYQACNLGMLLAHVFSAVSFYACCRILRYHRLWSFVGAALYGLTYYNIFRALGNLHLACSYVLPFAVLCSWLVLSSKRLRRGNRLAWICVITSPVMGLGGPYNLNMYVQLMCFSMLANFLTSRRKENLKVGAISLGLAALGFLAINAHTLATQWAHGKNTAALARNYFEAELYALKPMEFIIPPLQHHIEAFGNIAAKYRTSAFVRGEMFSAYLGVIVFAAMLWALGELFVFLLACKDGRKRIPPHGLQIIWVIAYSIVGGINCLIALAGFQLFRATIRYSIFVSLISLLFLVARMSVLGRHWPRQVKLGLAAALLLFGLYDQLPRHLPFKEVSVTQKMLDSDREFSARLEKQLPHAAMVFQLPVMVFPEAPPLRGVQGYQMLRPFLYTHNLRFTYGAIRGRPREDWQWDVEKMPVPQMISQLEKYGFAGIYILRACYEDRGEDLLKQLAAAGKNQVIEDELHEQVCVLLNPAAQPELPHTDNRALLQFKRGWTIKMTTPGDNREWSTVANHEWAGGDATASFFSEDRQTTMYGFTCLIGSPAARRVIIEVNGREIWSGQIPAGQLVQVSAAVTAHWGANAVKFKTDEPPTHSAEGLPLAFTIENLEISKAAP